MPHKFLTPTPSELITRYLICFSVLNIFIGPVALLVNGWPYELANIRNWQIPLTLACVLHVIWHKQNLTDYMQVKLSKKILNVFSASILISYLFASYMHLYGFKLNGMDFSIFDWMLYNTSHREFMVAPLCNNCNHFGVHPSYIMLPLVYLHRLWTSPLMLQTVQALCAWGAGLILWRIAKWYMLGDLLALLLCIAFWTNSWTGSILITGFHLEVFYLPVGLYLVYAWLTRSRLHTWIAAFLFLSIKEDAAFYLSAMMIGTLLFERTRWRESLAVLATTLVVAIINFKMAQPYFLSFDQVEHPLYLLRFWGAYGNSKQEILWTMATSPWRVFVDIISSRWYWLYGAAFFIPLLAPRALFAALPILILYGTATGVASLRNYSMYYSAPLLPFLFWGFVEGTSRLLTADRTAYRPSTYAIVILATISFCFVGGGYLRFPRAETAVLQDMRELRADPGFADKTFCVQPILHPHLPYEWNLQGLDASCLGDKDNLVIIHPRLSRTPLGDDEYHQLLQMTESVRELAGGTNIRRLR